MAEQEPDWAEVAGRYGGISGGVIVLGGVLAADSHPIGEINDDELSALAHRYLTLATNWSPAEFESSDFRERFEAEARRPAALWVPPEPEVLRANASRLQAAFDEVITPLGELWFWSAPTLRVGTLETKHAVLFEYIALLTEVRMCAHVWRRGAAWHWQWPIRVGVVPGSDAAMFEDQIRNSHYRYLVDIVPAEDLAYSPVDLAVVDWSDDDAVQYLRDGRSQISALIALNTDTDNSAALDAIFDRAFGLGVSAVLATPEADLAWFDNLLVELSHDQPLDVAIVNCGVTLWVASDPDFLAITAPRNWIFELLRAHGRTARTEPMHQILQQSFQMEGSGGRDTSDANRNTADAAGRRFDVTGDSAHETASAALPASEPPPDESPDTRRLQARVRDWNSKLRTYGFVRGKRHTVAIRIARESAQTDVVTASAAFPMTSDKELELVVVLRVLGTDEVARRTLALPPRADSSWTRGVGFTAPRSSMTNELAVRIDVLHENRTIQSATLRGPLLDAADDGNNLVLEVDRSSAPGESRKRADVALLVGESENGPFVVEPARLGRISGTGMQAAADRIASVLEGSFEAHPESLEEARPYLEDLAVSGSSLYKEIRAGNAVLDDASWIHIECDERADLPFELCYTHPMPDRDADICPPATAGETNCEPDCAHRSDSSFVCPYGFWATSAVVERRLHTPDRNNASISSERTVAVGPVASVAMSKRVDRSDNASSQRIRDAVERVAAEAFVAKDWNAMQQAASNEPSLVVLAVHNVPPPANSVDPRDAKVEVGGDNLMVLKLDESYINPNGRSPGPVVLALGCDTQRIEAGLATLVGVLHDAQAELVVSAISPVSGQAVSLFIESFMAAIDQGLSANQPVLFGEALTAARRELIACGNLTALALATSGDADVKLTKGT